MSILTPRSLKSNLPLTAVINGISAWSCTSLLANCNVPTLWYQSHAARATATSDVNPRLQLPSSLSENARARHRPDSLQHKTASFVSCYSRCHQSLTLDYG